jgi:hypothetical protein
VISILVLAVASAAGAEPYAVGDRIEPFTLEDQYGESHALDESVAIILFSRDMDGGDLLKAALEDVPEGFLTGMNAVYVSDISGMPGLIARLFAIPSMRKRPYALWLDRDGVATALFPDEEGKATFVYLSGLEITRIAYLETSQEIRSQLGLSKPDSGDD